MKRAHLVSRRGNLPQLVAWTVWAVCSGGFFLISCSKEAKVQESSRQVMEEHGMPADWKFTLPKGDPVEGRKVFARLECYKCHDITGETFPAVAKEEKGVGPELSRMAWMHPVEFFAESIISPNAVILPDDQVRSYLGEDGRSKMPDYTDLLTVKQMIDLVSYLASLKEAGHAGH